MNNFEPKYLKISSEYLGDKLESLNIKKIEEQEKKQLKKERSAFQKIVTKIFN